MHIQSSSTFKVIKVNSKVIALVLLCTLYLVPVNGQQAAYDNRISEMQTITDCRLKISKPFVLWSSLKLAMDGDTISPSNFIAADGFVVLSDAQCIKYRDRNITLSYRYIDMDPKLSFRVIDSTQLRKKPGEIYIGYDLSPEAFNETDAVFGVNGLDYSGSFSRGFSLGNAQSLVLDSRFDLQLQGEIGNGILIQAAISDDNIPIQPEGNTQVLQEFDRIFIQLSKQETAAVAGDFVIQRPNSYFINYYKKLKGIGIRNSAKFKNQTVSSEVNLASSRGKFARQTLSVKEGNQGPYKLTGLNNERFLIVLSGTEKIYFNGELLIRGQENDYVIDYNLAEITFSPRRLVARETRIIAEYEYTDLNYYRTLYTVDSRYQLDKTEIGIHFYSEQDSRKSTGQIELDSTSIAVLEAGGDNSENFNLSAIRRTNMTEEAVITYELVKNPNFPVEKNEYYLIYSADAGKELYTSGFTEVGAGKGGYVIDQAVALNGRVYKYVGETKGNYEPLKRLVPPEKKQMMGITVNHQADKNTKLLGELSLSQNDKNLFSPINDNDNTGLAGFLSIDGLRPMVKSSTDTLFWKYAASVESVNQNFQALNQYRSAEFIRDWNYIPKSLQRETITKLTSGFQNGSTFKMLAGFQSFNSAGNFNGQNINADVDVRFKGFQLSGKPSYTHTKDAISTGAFIRPNFRVTQNLPFAFKMQVGIDLEAESNLRDSINSGSPDLSSYRFYHVRSFIDLPGDGQTAFRFSYNKRQDDASSIQGLERITNIQEAEINFKWKAGDVSNLSTSMKIRDFEAVNPKLRPDDKSKLSLLGSLDHTLNVLRNALISATSYQISSGQEPKLEFVFQKVENLRGDYVYVGPDTASIKNINDFKYDPQNPLASYVRFSVPNNEFSTTNNIALQTSLRIEPFKYWSRDTSRLNWKKKWLSRFTNNSNVRLSNKILSSTQDFSAFNFSGSDTSVVSYSRSIVSAFFFNRGNPAYDVSYTLRSQGNKNNQINGFESRENREDEVRTRVNVWRNTDFILLSILGNKSFYNKLYADRNFDIQFNRLLLELNIRPSTSWRLISRYGRIKSEQSINNLESALKNEFSFVANFRRSSLSSIDVSLSYVDVNYTGKQGSLIEYDLLEGLKDGKNYLWSLNLTRRVSKMIDLNVGYEGRKTGSNAVIHVGRIQAKASF
ncbi:MAG: hypothetical protein IPN29_15205 [Saprospiraceae bacterium]|nr:hypothetical protein [Saprospiraceae bacterium]